MNKLKFTPQIQRVIALVTVFTILAGLVGTAWVRSASAQAPTPTSGQEVEAQGLETNTPGQRVELKMLSEVVLAPPAEIITHTEPIASGQIGPDGVAIRSDGQRMSIQSTECNDNCSRLIDIVDCSEGCTSRIQIFYEGTFTMVSSGWTVRSINGGKEVTYDWKNKSSMTKELKFRIGTVEHVFTIARPVSCPLPPTATPSPTKTPGPTKTSTPTKTVTMTPSPTATSTASPTPSPTATSTNTPTPTSTATETTPPTSTATNTPVPPTQTATATATEIAFQLQGWGYCDARSNMMRDIQYVWTSINGWTPEPWDQEVSSDASGVVTTTFGIADSSGNYHHFTFSGQLPQTCVEKKVWLPVINKPAEPTATPVPTATPTEVPSVCLKTLDFKAKVSDGSTVSFQAPFVPEGQSNTVTVHKTFALGNDIVFKTTDGKPVTGASFRRVSGNLPNTYNDLLGPGPSWTIAGNQISANGHHTIVVWCEDKGKRYSVAVQDHADP